MSIRKMFTVAKIVDKKLSKKRKIKEKQCFTKRFPDELQ